MSTKPPRQQTDPAPHPEFLRMPVTPPPEAVANIADVSRLRELTERIAHGLYETRGRVHGGHMDDWLAAEKQARARLKV